MVELIRETIRSERLLESVQSPRAGAVVLFLGTVRGVTDQQVTEALDYEAYEPMALAQLEQLETEARRRWPLIACRIQHRLGHLEVGETSVAVAVSSPHRRDAFAAAQWLMDAIKRDVPIWKKELAAGGAGQWVHPTPDSARGDA